jgi:hypothetical protein
MEKPNSNWFELKWEFFDSYKEKSREGRASNMIGSRYSLLPGLYLPWFLFPLCRLLSLYWWPGLLTSYTVHGKPSKEYLS